MNHEQQTEAIQANTKQFRPKRSGYNRKKRAKSITARATRKLKALADRFKKYGV